MKLIKIKNFATRMEAELARQNLQVEGIESVIQSPDVSIFGSFNAAIPQGADLYVQEEDEEQARKVIADLLGE